MTNSNEALLRSALFNRRANLYFAFITLIWMSVLAAHISLRFPWGGKDITHSKWCCAYLIFPALLAVILGVVRVFINPLTSKSEIFNAEIAEVYLKKGKNLHDTKEAGKKLKDSAKTELKVLFVSLFILSIACMAVAGCLDRATDKSKIEGLAIAECVLLAGIIIILASLAFTCYIGENGCRLEHLSSDDMKSITKEARSTLRLGGRVTEPVTTQLNSDRAQTI